MSVIWAKQKRRHVPVEENEARRPKDRARGRAVVHLHGAVAAVIASVAGDMKTLGDGAALRLTITFVFFTLIAGWEKCDGSLRRFDRVCTRGLAGLIDREPRSLCHCDR